MDILFKAPSLEWVISLYWSQFKSQNSTRKASNNLAWVIVLPLDHRRQDILIVMPIGSAFSEGGRDNFPEENWDSNDRGVFDARQGNIMMSPILSSGSSADKDGNLRRHNWT